MSAITLDEVKEYVRRKEWPSALAGADAMLADPAMRAPTRRALHVIRLRTMLLVPTSPDARRSAVEHAEEEFPNDPVIALMRGRVHRRTAPGSEVLRLARVAMTSPAHFAAAAGLAIEVLLERGRYAAAMRLAGEGAADKGEALDRLSVGTVSRLAGAAIVANHIEAAADLIAAARARDRYASGVQRYTMIIANTMRERVEVTAPHPRHIAILSATGDDALRFGVAVAPRLGLTFVGDTAQLTNEDAPWVCARCGPECPSLDDEFRFEMQQSDRRWFARIAAHLGADAILSCEKSVLHYLNHDPLRRFDTIILYATPDEVVEATIDRLKGLPLAKGGLAAAVGKAMDAWSHANVTYLELAASAGSAIALNIAAFERDPEAHLPRLAHRLGLALQGAEADAPPMHFAAAASASLALPSADRSAGRAVWPDDIAEEVASNRHTAFLHQALERRYRSAFPPS